MRIGIIGESERKHPEFRRAARMAGHDIVFHGEWGRDPVANDLSSVINRADLVVIVTDAEHPDTVRLARRIARRSHRSALMLRRLRLPRFLSLLEDMRSQQGWLGQAEPLND